MTTSSSESCLHACNTCHIRQHPKEVTHQGEAAGRERRAHEAAGGLGRRSQEACGREGGCKKARRARWAALVWSSGGAQGWTRLTGP
eukprot:614413-Prymnesium_polylepis.1